MTPFLEYLHRKYVYTAFTLIFTCVIIMWAISTKMFMFNITVGENSKLINFDRNRVDSLQLPKSAHNKFQQIDNWRNLSRHDISKLSNLGRRLFLNDPIGVQQNRKFIIHVWKHLSNMHNRYIKHYTAYNHDPFEHCSVSNCEITSDDSEVSEADAVLFHLFHFVKTSGPPTLVPRHSSQLWVLLADENPHNVMYAAKDKNLSHYRGLFNWTMTYMMDADVPVPYGRTVRLLPGERRIGLDLDGFGNKTKNIAIMNSNCGGANGRFDYVKELQKHIPVDVYGECGNLKCPGHFNMDCPLINDYKFYLAFENTNCDDYITEKVWWHALYKGAVPVVMGAPRASYRKQLPPHSFIHVEDFSTPRQLADYLRNLLENSTEYAEYHSWRSEYHVLNEHGYFQAPMQHFCHMCEALNYNSRPREGATDDLLPYLDHNKHCHPAKWTKS